MNENDAIDHLNDVFFSYDDTEQHEEAHLYGTIGDFCGLIDTYDAKFVWEKLPTEYKDMLLHAIDQSRLQGS